MGSVRRDEMMCDSRAGSDLPTVRLVIVLCVWLGVVWSIPARAATDDARYKQPGGPKDRGAAVRLSPTTDEALYKQYTDPGRRFLFDYPATMKVRSADPNEVHIFHPAASFRIAVYVEKRKTKSGRTAQDLLTAFKKELEKENKDVSLLGEGKLEGLSGSQGFVVVSFKDRKGTQFVQLVQYYVTENASLQMTISDRPWGFKNLEPVIKKVHQSLRIIDPTLK
jgi:hypothetical protein